jgi:hypothetical protein
MAALSGPDIVLEAEAVANFAAWGCLDALLPSFLYRAKSPGLLNQARSVLS